MASCRQRSSGRILVVLCIHDAENGIRLSGHAGHVSRGFKHYSQLLESTSLGIDKRIDVDVFRLLRVDALLGTFQSNNPASSRICVCQSMVGWKKQRNGGLFYYYCIFFSAQRRQFLLLTSQVASLGTRQDGSDSQCTDTSL
jgi:hypothetical protein